MMQSDDPRLTAYVLGELDESARQEVESELEQSAMLREEVEAIRQTTALLNDSLQSEPCPALTSQQRAEIQDESADSKVVLSERATGGPRRNRWRYAAAIGTSLALVSILCALTFSHFNLFGPSPRRAAMQAVDKSWLTAESVASSESTSEPGDGYAGSVAGAASRVTVGDGIAGDVSSGGRRFAGESALDPVGLPGSNRGANERSWSVTPSDEWGEGESLGRGQPAPDSIREMSERDDAFGVEGGALGGGRQASGGFAGGGGFGNSGVATDDAAVVAVDREHEAEMFGDRFGSAVPNVVTSPAGAEPLATRPLGGVTGGNAPAPATPRDFMRESGDSPADDPEPPVSEATPALTELADATPQVVRQVPAESSVFSESLRTAPKVAAGREVRAARPRIIISDEEKPLDGMESRVRGELAAADKSEEAKQDQATWRRAQATPNASRLVIGDRDELLMEGMQANVHVDGFRARVLLDLYYFNNRGRQLEGNFKLRLPNDASLYYFAFGQSAYEYRPQVDHLTAKGFLSGDDLRLAGLDPAGILKAREGSWSNVKEARIVPREKAAHAYSETVRRRVDPALVEWSGAGVFNARVFPLMPKKLHRIVVGYDVNLQQVGEDLLYRLDLPEDVSQCMVDLNVSALPGTTAEIQPETRPFTSGGRAYYHLHELSDRQVELRLKASGTSMLAGKDPEAGDFFATRITPELAAGEMEAGRQRAVFLVDTSLSSRPDKFNVWLDLLEASLASNRDSMQRFAVLFFNIESHWWKEGFVDNNEQNVDELLTFCRSLSLEGATDLQQALTEAASPAWASQDEDKPRRHDLFLLSDGAVTWGEMNIHQLSKTFSQQGSLFAYKTGMSGTATGVLEHLTRESGGAVFSVVNEEEVASAATAHRRRPWELLDVTVAGGSDLLVAGRPNYIYAGQPLLIVGRGEPDAEVMLHVRRGDEDEHLSVKIDQVIPSDLASRAYGQVSVGQLEDLGSSLEDVSVAYARHFRVTGRTCSLLMLDNEADYQRFNIKPEDDVFVVRSTPSAGLITKKLDELAERLGDAKASVVAWIGKLENTAGFEFKVPTALRLVIDRLPREAFTVKPQTLRCKSRERGDAPKAFVQQLDRGKLDYATVTAQASQRFEKHGAADGLRTLSSLVEQNPGDPVLTRDVAFSAIEWGLAGQAYPLLKRTALMRPYEPQSYLAMAQCLAGLGHADLAMIYYEITLNARWHQRYKDVHQIAGVEYLRLLRRVNQGKLSSHVPEYAAARIGSLAKQTPIRAADLVITMMWNTDRTDVDLHVVEPTGEECYYDHPQTRIGGRITRDVTEGYGPEMYTLANAKHGNYKILANYFGTDANRTNVRSKVYITVYENFGRERERVTKKTITLSNGKEKRELTRVLIEK